MQTSIWALFNWYRVTKLLVSTTELIDSVIQVGAKSKKGNREAAFPTGFWDAVRKTGQLQHWSVAWSRPLQLAGTKMNHKRVKWLKSLKRFSLDSYRHSLMSENFDIQTASWRRQNLWRQRGAEGVVESAPTWEKSDPHLAARHSGLRLTSGNMAEWVESSEWAR